MLYCPVQSIFIEYVKCEIGAMKCVKMKSVSFLWSKFIPQDKQMGLVKWLDQMQTP